MRRQLTSQNEIHFNDFSLGAWKMGRKQRENVLFEWNFLIE